MASCSTHKCLMCRRRIDGSEANMHFQTCQYQHCSQCNASITAEYYDLHLQSCTVAYCRACRTHVALGDLSKHQELCTLKKYRWKSTELLPPMSDTVVTKTILSPTTRFPVLLGMKRTMEAWLKYPSSTIVVDFEYMVGPGFPLLPIQIAIANAHGDWIVPATPVNYRISKREPLERRNKLGSVNRTLWEKMVVKFYGADNIWMRLPKALPGKKLLV
jgi:hypothetical protein